METIRSAIKSILNIQSTRVKRKEDNLAIGIVFYVNNNPTSYKPYRIIPKKSYFYVSINILLLWTYC